MLAWLWVAGKGATVIRLSAKSWLTLAALALVLSATTGFLFGRDGIDAHAARNRALVRRILREELAAVRQGGPGQNGEGGIGRPTWGERRHVGRYLDEGGVTAEDVAVLCCDYCRF